MYQIPIFKFTSYANLLEIKHSCYFSFWNGYSRPNSIFLSYSVSMTDKSIEYFCKLQTASLPTEKIFYYSVIYSGDPIM